MQVTGKQHTNDFHLNRAANGSFKSELEKNLCFSKHSFSCSGDAET